jgi:hypothetical protein
MTDHDQLFKEVFQTFFADLLRLVIPELAQQLDLEHIELLREEFFTDLPQGERRRLDLLAATAWRKLGKEAVRRAPPPLVHVEIESQAHRAPPDRWMRYGMQIILRHRRPVLPIVVILRGGRSGIRRVVHRVQAGGLELSSFAYYAFGVAASPAEEFLARDEPLAWALAALMRPGPRSRAGLKTECLNRLANASLDDARRFLLVNVVETYLELHGRDLEEYQAMLAEKPNRPAADLETTWADRLRAEGRQEGQREGEELGLERGRREGRQQLLLSLLERRFGPLSTGVIRRVQAMTSGEELVELAERAPAVASLDELGLSDR